MLFDIQEQLIYERALEEGDIVVFVRDNEKQVLRSYSLPL
jgi:hypothetical protein